VTLAWLPPLTGTPTSYVIEAGTYDGLADIGVFDTKSAATTTTFDGVPPGTYHIRVRAANAVGHSVVSNEIQVVVP
jgi:hypothetical protein